MTLAVATLAPWQHSSPTGGLISTEWVSNADLRPGMVTRTRTGWQGITTLETRIGVGLIATVEDDTRLWLGLGQGLEVRRDCLFEPAPIAACGCWDTSYMPHGGIWTCDAHRRTA